MKLGKLEYSIISGEGRVIVFWRDMPNDVMMLDILKDWITELEGIYEVKRNEVFYKGESK